MKTVKYVTLAVILIAIGGYSAYWYTKASAVEKHVKAYLDHLAQDESLGFDYDSLDKGGFPLTIDIALTNPKLKILTKEQPVEINLSGKVVKRVRVFGGLEAMEFQGITHILVPKLEGEPLHHFIVEGKITTEAHLPPIDTTDLEAAWRSLNIDNAKITLRDFKIMDAMENTKIVEVDYVALGYKYRSDEAGSTIDFNTMINGFDFTDLLHYADRKDPSANTPKLLTTFTEAVWSKHGKMDLLMDMSLQVPQKEILQEIGQNPALYFSTKKIPLTTLTINKFEYTNNFGEFQAKGHLGLKEDDEKNVTLIVDYVNTNQYSKEYNEALAAGVQAVEKAAETLEPSDANEVKAKYLFKNHRDEVMAVIPQLNTLGTVTLTAKGEFTFNKENSLVDHRLDKIEFLSDLFGVRMYGTVKGSLSAHTELGSLTIDLLKYKDLIRETVSYFNRVEKVYNVFAEENRQLSEITPETTEKIIAFVEDISNQPESRENNNISVTATNLNGQFQVGTLTLQDFQIKASTLVAELNNDLSRAASGVR